MFSSHPNGFTFTAVNIRPSQDCGVCILPRVTASMVSVRFRSTLLTVFLGSTCFAAPAQDEVSFQVSQSIRTICDHYRHATEIPFLFNRLHLCQGLVVNFHRNIILDTSQQGMANITVLSGMCGTGFRKRDRYRQRRLADRHRQTQTKK